MGASLSLAIEVILLEHWKVFVGRAAAGVGNPLLQLQQGAAASAGGGGGSFVSADAGASFLALLDVPLACLRDGARLPPAVVRRAAGCLQEVHGSHGLYRFAPFMQASEGWREPV